MPAPVWLGFAAATLTTLAFLPQVLKVWRRRRADDLSPATFGLFGAGVVLWLVYGILLRDPPLIAANAVTLALVGSLLAMAVRFRRRHRRGRRRRGRRPRPWRV